MKRYATLFWSIGLYVISVVGWSQTPQLRLQTVATGLTKPVDVVSAGTNRLFVAEMGGKIKIIESTGTVLSTPFLQIPADRLLDVEYNGIYSIAFHPNFASNGYFYVFYNQKDGQGILSRFTRNGSNPNGADLASELVLMTFPFPDKGHRGGKILFGPDGYLYIFVGDDGNVGRGQMGDVLGNAQNLQKRYGKILRIDVNSGSPYGIPPTNPYLTPGDGIPDEIWARGLRNPWRCSFDRETGDLWLGDNGQDGYEEVDFVAATTGKIVPAAQNFGWRCYEGAHPYATADCNPAQSLVMPLHEYAGFSNNGNQSASVVGGYVYRGNAYPSLRGWYVYGDYAQGKLWLLRREANNTYQTIVQTPTLVNPIGFGEGADGELYVLTFNEGTLYRITTSESPVAMNRPPVAPSPPALAATVGQAFTTTLPVFTDPDADPLTYALTSLPAGLTFNAGSRQISGTPTQSGTFSLVYSATDGFLKTDLSISLTVAASSTVVTGNFEGFLDVVNCSTISGWVWNRDKPNTPLPVEFLDGATSATAVLIGSTLANVYRQDLKNANKGNGEHGYSFVVPESLKDNQTHTIWGRVQGSTYILKWAPKTINCAGTGLPPTNAAPVAPAVSSLTAPVNVAYASAALPAFSDAESDPLSYSLTSLPSGLSFNAVTRVISGTPTQQGTFNLAYAATDGKHTPVSTTLTLTVNGTVATPPVVTGNFEGYLSVVNCQEMRGWVWDRNKPNTPLTVEFFADGNTIGTVEAKNYRQDLKDAGKGNGEHGYVFQTPSAMRDNVNHQISAKVKNSTYTLKGSPMSLQCASSARLLASSETSGLEVVVRGNPVTGDELVVEVRGAAGQPLRLQLNDLNGRLISERQLEQAQEVEQHTLGLNHHPAGLLLLRISTPTRSKTVKVVKLN
ncbi:PQQ-dependent sugar dehydrogenase [Larkinella punicea]|uniref:T9SS C-terminal target domain-containing protein n=1 Tax=Larkinella punicea TaxID=2315727 RepID=A0A368JMC9_9BACT|nr:PQQ-dependent sugar dehydrogenase [Larkinella punicea]RCR67301.1 T9SS C-terminal target domain-containing protein [Larkinella punicea]